MINIYWYPCTSFIISVYLLWIGRKRTSNICTRYIHRSGKKNDSNECGERVDLHFSKKPQTREQIIWFKEIIRPADLLSACLLDFWTVEKQISLGDMWLCHLLALSYHNSTHGQYTSKHYPHLHVQSLKTFELCLYRPSDIAVHTRCMLNADFFTNFERKSCINMRTLNRTIRGNL